MCALEDRTLPPVRVRDRHAFLKIPGKVLLEPRCDAFIEYCKVDFVVQSERTVVEVRRADHAPYPVNDHGFGVNHRGAILVDLRPRLEQLTVQATARTSGQHVIDVFARSYDPDFD